ATACPCRASSIAIARPMPRDDPVTKAAGCVVIMHVSVAPLSPRGRGVGGEGGIFRLLPLTPGPSPSRGEGRLEREYYSHTSKCCLARFTTSPKQFSSNGLINFAERVSSWNGAAPPRLHKAT